MSSSPDPDLSDVFKLLYADEEDDTWGAFSDDDQATPEDALPRNDLERVEEDVLPQADLRERYTRKRFLAEIDSLFDRSTSQLSSKRQRIFPAATTKPSTTIITSTSPLPSLPSLKEYAPFSPLPLLARLRTYQPSTFSSFPPPLDSTTLALSGWNNVARDSLWCEQCGSTWDVRGIKEIGDDKVKNEVIRRLGATQRDRHHRGCAWKVTASPGDLVGKIPGMLHPLLSSSLGILSQRLQEECLAYGEIRWSSPLTQEELQVLSKNISRHSVNAAVHQDPATASVGAAMALFGWYPYHPKRDSAFIDLSVPPHRTDIVCCRICCRRIGLWAHKKEAEGKRGFDLREEHIEWCPLRKPGWWSTSRLLRREEKGETRSLGGGSGLVGWVSVSDKMEKKPWRR